MQRISPALNFQSFLNEAENNESVDILMLSGESKPSKTAKSFAEECEKRGLTFNVVNVNNVVLEKVYNGHVVKYTDGEEAKEILIRPETTAIVPRGGVITNSYTKQIMRDLEASRYFCVNSLESIEICESKYLTSKVLDEEGLPTPKYALVNSTKGLDRALEEVGGEFPIP